jgi:hypothetical protein
MRAVAWEILEGIAKRDMGPVDTSSDLTERCRSLVAAWYGPDDGSDERPDLQEQPEDSLRGIP